jgi:RNA polymerase sigma-70 factor (ECF subfamily)
MEINKKHINPERIREAAIEFSKGSTVAFSFLYSIFNRPIYRFCKRILSDEQTAKDAFQETFVRIYEHRASFNGNNFESWLFTTARNTCINYIRKRKRLISLGEQDYGYTPSKYMKIGIREHIDEMLSRLPLSLKEAIVLRDMQDMTYKDISEVLGIDLSLAKVRVHRARLKLKELLEPLMRELYEST